MNNSLYVFDVDGVLCDIGSPQLNPDVLKKLSTLLAKNAHVAVNTGRGYDRIGGELIEPLLTLVTDKNDLDHLFVSTEMGGELHTFNDELAVAVRSEHSLTPAQLKKAREIYDQQSPHTDTMHWYEPKKSMATVVKTRGTDQARFLKQRNHLLSLYEQAFSQDPTVVVASTAESIDVHTVNAGKYAGAKAAFQWSTSVAGDTPAAITCFGDSNNDYEMARFFAHKDIGVHFVYTGTVPLTTPDPHDNIKVILPKAKMSLGTLEYLSSLQN